MRQIVILSGLLAAALVGSYVTWTADEVDTTKAEQVMVYRADAEDVQSLTWKEDAVSVVIEPKSDARGPYTWVTMTSTATPDPGTDVEGAPPPAPEPPKVVSFKGNEQADQVWAAFAPLYALRELHPEGGISDTAFGFDKPTGTIEVARKSGALTLLVGGETYGAKDKYVKSEGRVFLLDDKTIRPLQYSQTRLIDRLLEPSGEAKARTVEITAGERKASFVHQNHDDPHAAFWARAETPTQEDSTGAAWIGKLMRMRIQDYDVPADESGLKPLFAYSVGDGTDSWGVEVLQSEGDDPQFYAHSEFARGLVHLTESTTSEAFADLDSAFTKAP